MSSSSPLDPDFLKIPAFQRKKIIKQKIQPPAAFTVEDAMRSSMSSAQFDGSYEDPLISSSFSRAKEQTSRSVPSRQEQLRSADQSRYESERRLPVPSTRKRVMTPKPRDVHTHAFGSISLQPSSKQPSLHQSSLLQAPSAHALLRTYQEVGAVVATLPKIEVAIIKVALSLRLGDILLFQDDIAPYEERVTSMQINRKDVKLAKKGSDIGMKVSRLPRSGTKVYRVAS